MQNSQVIIGIDPGTIITGYGIISKSPEGYQAIDYGCISPPKKMQLSERYHIIFHGLSQLIQANEPQALIVESQFVYKNPQSALKLGMATACAILAAKEKKLPVYTYAPTKIKLSLTGKGSASKAQVQGMIQALLKLQKRPEPEDASDALAVALCHFFQKNTLLEKQEF